MKIMGTRLAYVKNIKTTAHSYSNLAFIFIPFLNDFALVDQVYKSFLADRLVACYVSSTTQPACQSLNYNLADKSWEVNSNTKYFRSKYFVEKPRTFMYVENPDSVTILLFDWKLTSNISYFLRFLYRLKDFGKFISLILFFFSGFFSFVSMVC